MLWFYDCESVFFRCILFSCIFDCFLSTSATSTSVLSRALSFVVVDDFMVSRLDRVSINRFGHFYFKVDAYGSVVIMC